MDGDERPERNALAPAVVGGAQYIEQLGARVDSLHGRITADRRFHECCLRYIRGEYSIDSFLTNVFGKLLECMDAYRGSIALRSQSPFEKETHFYIVTHKGIPKEGIENGLIGLVEGNQKIAEALEQKGPIIINEGGRSSILSPFGWDDKNEGVICLSRTGEQQAYSQEDEETLKHYAEVLSELAKEIIGKRRVLAQQVALVELRDRYTGGHCFRVSGYGKEFADAAGLSIREQEQIRVGGLLHDIGKIGIADGILNKPGRLSDEEWAAMKSHTERGANSLAREIDPEEHHKGIIGMALLHHERYDGGGYPLRLSEEEIPLAPRILAVADAYDAMVLKRCYSDAKSPEDVIAEFKRGMGEQFDPHLARLFLGIRPELAWVDMNRRVFHTPHCTTLAEVPLELLTLSRSPKLRYLGFQECQLCYTREIGKS